MNGYIPIANLAEEKKLASKENDKFNELLALFDKHNLISGISESEHIFANALAMLIAAIHWHGNIKQLFESLPHIKDRKIDLLDILNTMTHLGYSRHNMVTEIAEIDERLMPCLFIPHNKDASPLILLSKKNGIINTFQAKKKQIIEIVIKDLVGDTYFFKKNDPEEIEEEVQIKKAAGLTWMDVIFSRFKPIMNEIFLTSIVINVLSLAMPFFIMSIYRTVIGAGSTVTLMQLVVGITIAIIGESILRVIRLKSIIWLGVRLDNIVSNTIFERLLLMRAAYTESASISSQISRIKTFESVRKFFTGPLFIVLVELPFTLILLLAIWFLTDQLVYIPIIVMLLFTLLLLYYRSKLKVAARTAARANSQRHQLGMETFIKMHSLHNNGMSKNWWSRYKEVLGYSSITSFKSNMMSSVIETIAHCISILAGIAVIVWGSELIWEEKITIGALIGTMMLIWRIFGPLQTLCSMLPRIEQLSSSIEQINRLVNIEIEHQPNILKKPIEHLQGNIKLSNVGLRYSVEVEPIFVGLDIEAKAGEVIAITGSNGSGKSSILKLINGLYQPQTGVIRIDETNIKQMEIAELRKYICYLPQMPSFFEGTIKDNLMLANPLATEEEIMHALEKATGLEELKNMEHGIETSICGNHPSLPNGYEYILNLARVMLKESNIMLLDELPNASLNEALGEAYKKLIEEAKGKKTVFFVSQRDDFIKLADRVIVLKTGTRPIIMKAEQFINQYGK